MGGIYIKKLIIIFILFFSILGLSGDIIYKINDVDLKKEEKEYINLYLNYNFKKEIHKNFDIRTGISYNDYKPFIETKNLLFKEVDMKVGERLFSVFADISLFDLSDFGIGYTWKNNSQQSGLFNTLSYSRTVVKKLSHSQYSYNHIEFSLPTFVSGTGISLNLKSGLNNYFLYKFSFKPLKKLKIPFYIGYSDQDIFTGIKIDSFDKYYNTGIGFGASLIKKNIYPTGEITFDINLFDVSTNISFRGIFKNSLDYNIYAYSHEFNLPIVFYLSKNGGGFFFEL